MDSFPDGRHARPRSRVALDADGEVYVPLLPRSLASTAVASQLRQLLGADDSWDLARTFLAAALSGHRRRPLPDQLLEDDRAAMGLFTERRYVRPRSDVDAEVGVSLLPRSLASQLRRFLGADDAWDLARTFLAAPPGHGRPRRPAPSHQSQCAAIGLFPDGLHARLSLRPRLLIWPVAAPSQVAAYHLATTCRDISAGCISVNGWSEWPADMPDHIYRFDLSLLNRPIQKVTRENSWAKFMGHPMEQKIADTCTLVACTVCLEAVHRYVRVRDLPRAAARVPRGADLGAGRGSTREPPRTSSGVYRDDSVLLFGRRWVGSHAVVCFGYRFTEDPEGMHVLILDNHTPTGPTRWVDYEEIDALYTLGLKPALHLAGRPLTYPLSL
ncbi:hypothetical protein ACP70R_042127 [Stipagrostis hirtigluma subsp. patula]